MGEHKNSKNIKMKLFSAACLVGVLSASVVNRAPDGCIVKLMKQIEQDMIKCDQSEDVEEFKCVTSTFKKFFTGAAQCIAGIGRDGMNEVMKCEFWCLKDMDSSMGECTGTDIEIDRCSVEVMREFFKCTEGCAHMP